jgi:signal transduction histidine kinase
MSAHPHSRPHIAPARRRGTRDNLTLVAAGQDAGSPAELAASRARVVAAGDEARRRMQRALHNGAHQGLVNTILALKMARTQLGAAGATGPGVDLVDEALHHAEGAIADLRELAHGILPGALIWGGLRGGIAALVARVDLPVEAEVTADRLDEAVEATAYFVVAEALANAVTHARATRVRIAAVVDSGALRVEVADDGVGGSLSRGGDGLVGLCDRVAAVNGALRVESARGTGTLVTATLPVA